MPYIEVLTYGTQLTSGQKQRLFAEVTRASTRCLDVTVEQVRIAVQEWPADSCFDGSRETRPEPAAGIPTDE